MNAWLGGRDSNPPIGGSRDRSLTVKLDSVARVELLGAIEDRYQVEINEAAFSDATTVGDIQNLIREGSAGGVALPLPER